MCDACFVWSSRFDRQPALGGAGDGDGKCEGEGCPIEPLTILTLLVIFCIALGVGTDITVESMRNVWRKKKVGFIIGWVSQYGFMPMVTATSFN